METKNKITEKQMLKLINNFEKKIKKAGSSYTTELYKQGDGCWIVRIWVTPKEDNNDLEMGHE